MTGFIYNNIGIKRLNKHDNIITDSIEQIESNR